MMHVVGETQEMSFAPEWEPIPMVGAFVKVAMLLAVAIMVAAVTVFAFQSPAGAEIACFEDATTFSDPISDVRIDLLQYTSNH